MHKPAELLQVIFNAIWMQCNLHFNELFNVPDINFPLEGDFFSQILTSDSGLAMVLGFHNMLQYFTRDKERKKIFYLLLESEIAKFNYFLFS